MTTHVELDELFESRVSFPDPDYRERLQSLVGLDSHKSQLTKILGLQVNPARLQRWIDQHHPGADLVGNILRRPPLAILGGDVGTGKTELASTIGDAVARAEGIPIILFPLSLSTRGQGRVGEMTRLLTAAFDCVETEARKVASTKASRGGVLLLVDEADALAQSREASQMHHEDRAGVNAFIRGVDRLAAASLPAAIIMCTNRIDALDPAVRRRAATILTFARPNAAQRHAALHPVLSELGLESSEIAELVALTGETPSRPYGFTYSDLLQQLLPTIILEAFPLAPVTGGLAVEIARTVVPTPPFQNGALP